MVPDVIVIGGGIAGAALTYTLAREGVRVVLLERGHIAGEASGATMGMALWTVMHSEAEMDLAGRGVRRLATLAAELEADFNYRLLPSLALAPNEEILAHLQQYAAAWQSAGLVASVILDPVELASLEPALATRSLAGALFAEQGHLDGIALTQAFARAAQRLGADIREYTPVTNLKVDQDRVVAVETGSESLAAAKVVLATGAWTRQVGALAGVNLAVYYIQGEAVMTAPVPLKLRAILMLAQPGGHSGLEEQVADALGDGTAWEGRRDDTAVQDTAIVQLPDSRVLLGQVSRALPQHYLSFQPATIDRLRQGAAALVPGLAEVPIQHCWIAPVPFTPGHQEFLGLLLPYTNLYLFAGFKSALLTAPVAAEDLARQITAAG